MLNNILQNKKTLVISIVVVFTLVVAGVWMFLNQPSSEPIGMILFYGDTCSHCANLEDFIVKNKIEDKVKFTRLEVFNNQDNANILVSKAQICKIDLSQGAPVPFFWDGKTCIIGDQAIMDFMQNKAK